jgi:hypothetical protein
VESTPNIIKLSKMLVIFTIFLSLFFPNCFHYWYTLHTSLLWFNCHWKVAMKITIKNLSPHIGCNKTHTISYYSTVVLERNRELYGISLQNEGMYCLQSKLCFFLVSLVYIGLSQSLLSCSFVILSLFGGIFPGLKV